MRTRITDLQKGHEALISGIMTKEQRFKRPKQEGEQGEPWFLVKIKEPAGAFASAQVWNNLEIFPTIEELEDGMEVEAEVLCTELGQYVNIDLKSIKKIERKENQIVDLSKLQNELRTFIKEMKDEHLKKLICLVLARPDMKEAYWEAPVTMQSAYCFKGGVVAKVVREIRLVKAIAGVFNGWEMNEDNFSTRLNEEFLCAMCVLDPIGKVKAYRWENARVARTFEGELLEESELTARVVWEEMSKIQMLDEQKLIIEHVLGASKGRQDHGALHASRSRESDVFHLLNKMNFVAGQFEFLDRNANAMDQFAMLFDRSRKFLGVYDQ